MHANTAGDVLDVHTPLAMVGADGYCAGWSTTVGLFTFVKAVEIDNQAIVQLLLNYNVDFNTVDQSGRNALHLAARCGIVGAATTLARLVASLNVLNKHGETALLIAAENGHAGIVTALVGVKKPAANRKCAKCVRNGQTTASAKSNADAKLLVCSVCAASKSIARFAKAQRGKKDARKCSDCITEADLKHKEAAAATAAASLLEEEAAAPPSRKKGDAKGARTQKADAAALHVQADQKDGKRMQAARDHATTKQQRAVKIKAEKAAEQAKEADRPGSSARCDAPRGVASR